MKDTRRKQLISLAKNETTVGPWVVNLRKFMTAGEIRQVNEYWDTLEGWTSFYDAFMSVPENWQPGRGQKIDLQV